VALRICAPPAFDDPPATFASLLQAVAQSRQSSQMGLRIDLHRGEPYATREDARVVQLRTRLLHASAVQHDAAEHAVGDRLRMSVARGVADHLPGQVGGM